MANAAWLAVTVMAHNLARATGRLAGPDLEKAPVTTLQRRIFTVPGRLVRSAVAGICDSQPPGPG